MTSAAEGPKHLLHCVIIGGGPAGLTAAIYLARFHLTVRVIDAGFSRAALIPLTRNHAGFPDGISGVDLLGRMRQQVSNNGVQIDSDAVVDLARAPDGFVAQTAAGHIAQSRTVLLATGVVNRRPDMIDDACHDAALAQGRLRYCPICDGYEVTDKAIAVLGTGERGFNEAIFLRGFSADVTLIAPRGGHELQAEQRDALTAASVAMAGPSTAIRLVGDKIALDVEGESRRFDTLYPALGSDIRSELASMVGAAGTDDGCLTVDAHQRTNVSGLYAAGDVVLGLDQINHAMGEGGVAATTIRNDLARTTPLLR